MMTPEQQAFAEYILSDEYRRLLWRAILSRLSTSSGAVDKHLEALRLFEAAYPRDDWP